MSSILDALRKLEEEKSAAAETADIAVDDALAERDLIGGGGGIALHVSPWMLFAAGGGLFVATVAVTVAAVVLVNRSAPLPQVAYQVPAPPIAAITQDSAPAEPSVSTAPVADTVTVTQDATPSAVVTPAPPKESNEESTPPPLPAPPRVDLQGPAATVSPTATPSPRITELESIPMERDETQTETPVETAEVVQEYPKDVNLWPRLSTAVKARIMGDKKLHMARPLGRPRPSAVIDMEPVYVGEVIPETKARLVEVTGFGVGIEVIGTGERYYWRMGV